MLGVLVFLIIVLVLWCFGLFIIALVFWRFGVVAGLDTCHSEGQQKNITSR